MSAKGDCIIDWIPLPDNPQGRSARVSGLSGIDRIGIRDGQRGTDSRSLTSFETAIRRTFSGLRETTDVETRTSSKASLCAKIPYLSVSRRLHQLLSWNEGHEIATAAATEARGVLVETIDNIPADIDGVIELHVYEDVRPDLDAKYSHLALNSRFKQGHLAMKAAKTSDFLRGGCRLQYRRAVVFKASRFRSIERYAVQVRAL